MSSSNRISSWSLGLKRSFDLILACISLVLFSPLILIIYILIKVAEPHAPAIYSQERIGKEGKPFILYKFRSMRTDAESLDCPQLYQGEKDPRLTRVGAFIRAHHLDEFPQLWNVVRGDMSFVGYRPERKFYIDQIMERNPNYQCLYQMRPGLFSHATLYNGYTDTIEKMLERLRLDLEYVNNYSFWMDIKIITYTTFFIIFGKKF